MEKINFVNNSEPYLSAENLNQMQENIENTISNVTSESSIGNATTGKLGVEWGQVEVTSGESGTTAQGTTIYVGQTDITFKNKYKKNPQVITGWRSGYYNQISTYASSVTTTGAKINGYLSSANSTRTVGYLVIGEIE